MRSASRTDSARRERGYSRPSSEVVMMPRGEETAELLLGPGTHDRFDECGVVIPLRINRFVGEVAAAVAGRKELKAAGDIALNDADAFASTCGHNGGGEA